MRRLNSLSVAVDWALPATAAGEVGVAKTGALIEPEGAGVPRRGL